MKHQQWRPATARMFPRLVAIALLVHATASATGQIAIPQRDAFVIENNTAAEKRLAMVGDYVRQERFDAAIGLLREVATGRPDAVIRLDETRSLSVARYCDILLSQFPPEGLATYRRGVDAQANAWMEAARQTGDVDYLERVVERRFASSHGDEALDELAARAWEQGDIERARMLWTMLLPPESPPEGAAPPIQLRYPQTDLDMAGIKARLILCAIALDETDRARRDLALFAKEHPRASGWLAGMEGRFVDRLQGLLPEFQTHESSDNSHSWVPKSPELGTQMIGANASRDGALPFAPSIGLPVWATDFPTGNVPVPVDRPALPKLPPLVSYPAVWRDKVFLANDVEIHGFEQATGRPAWSGDSEISSRIFPPAIDGALENSANPPASGIPQLGIPRYSLTISRNRLFARLGPPLTIWPSRVELRREASQIVCLDLAREGRVEWILLSTMLDEGDERWSFEGPPVPAGDSLFVLASRSHPQPALRLIHLDAQSGTIRWTRSLGTPLNLPPPGTGVVSHRLVTHALGRLYIPTDQGALLCLDARDGRTEWIAWYDSATRVAAKRPNYSDQDLPTACLVAGGTVVLAPNDSSTLFAFDATSGRTLWKREIRGGSSQILGARDLTLVVAGERLHGIHLETGQIQWSVGFENPAGFGAGRGLLGDRFAYWPTREDLFIVDWRSGEIVQRQRLHHVFGITGGGNLAASPNGLFLAGPGRLVGFGRFDLLQSTNAISPNK